MAEKKEKGGSRVEKVKGKGGWKERSASESSSLDAWIKRKRNTKVEEREKAEKGEWNFKRSRKMQKSPLEKERREEQEKMKKNRVKGSR